MTESWDDAFSTHFGAAGVAAMGADTAPSPAFYGAMLHAPSFPGAFPQEYKDSYARMLVDQGGGGDAGLNGFQRSLGFVELPTVPHGLSIFGGDAGRGDQIQIARAGSAAAAAARDGGARVREKQMQGYLDIHIHHAIGIQNVPMYKEQDVYAKLSLTHSDAEALRTKVVEAGGRNPVFNQGLQIAVNHHDPVLKCEIWMASENRRYLEDQMLAFVLVPLAALESERNHVQDHELVSTDLFHSPSGVVRLALAFHECIPSPTSYNNARDKIPSPAAYMGPVTPFSYPNLTHDLRDNNANIGAFNLGSLASLSGSMPSRLAMDVTVAEGGTLANVVSGSGPSVFEKVEFPDIRVACENQQMVSDYMTLASTDLTLVCPSEGDCYSKQAGVGDGRMASYPPQSSFTQGPFLQLGSFPVSCADYDMVVNSGERELKKPDCSLREDTLSSMYSSPGLQAMDECRIFSNLSGGDATSFSRLRNESAYISPSSCIVNEVRSPRGAVSSSQGSTSPVSSAFFGSSLSRGSLSRGSPADNVTLIDPENSREHSHRNLARQPLQSSSALAEHEEREVEPQDIVDLYTKSLQQFTECLGKMQVPVAALKDVSPGGVDLQNSVDTRKRLPTRIFYGSRAFF